MIEKLFHVERRNFGKLPLSNGTAGKRNISIPVAPRELIWSTSFSETSRRTSYPRSSNFSPTAIPGNRWPPVPPHAIATKLFLELFIRRIGLGGTRSLQLPHPSKTQLRYSVQC